MGSTGRAASTAWADGAFGAPGTPETPAMRLRMQVEMLTVALRTERAAAAGERQSFGIFGDEPGELERSKRRKAERPQ